MSAEFDVRNRGSSPEEARQRDRHRVVELAGVLTLPELHRWQRGLPGHPV
jgi:hypothetical protein